LETSIYKKNFGDVTFFQISKWGSNSRLRNHPLFYSFESCTAISQPILTYKPILVAFGKEIIGLKNMTQYCRLVSMVFEKAGGQGIVWRYLQRMYRPFLKENSRQWQNSLIYRGCMTTS
jgi:hypothetical protein